MWFLKITMGLKGLIFVYGKTLISNDFISYFYGKSIWDY